MYIKYLPLQQNEWKGTGVPLFFDIMTDRQLIIEIASEYLDNKDLFLVDVVISKENDIEIVIESEKEGVKLDDCVELSRFVESKLDREKEDFSLTVGSAGLNAPLKVFKQYKKHEGAEVEVTLKSGARLKGVLTLAEEGAITLTHNVSEKVEGQKKKVVREVVERFELSALKSVKPVIRFK